ncbi:MAG TPA: amylo-alpha-1,6-glucosidase, partial [Cytophagaceae bacterium]
KGEIARSKIYMERAFQIKNSFLKTFVRPDHDSLYDCVDGIYRDISVRPNQLFAISLPYPLLDKIQATAILKIVEDKLLTPFGLRSLSKDDPRYIGFYQGDQLSRDGAYHQGTVWSWLLGPYFTAKIKIEGEAGRQAVLQHLKIFETHLHDAGIGTVSEIFDGEAPYKPKGCVAQAWGVAEVLRAYVEDVLSLKKEKKNAKVKELIGI